VRSTRPRIQSNASSFVRSAFRPVSKTLPPRPAGREPLPQLLARRAHPEVVQLHAGQLSASAVDLPAPHVERLGPEPGSDPKAAAGHLPRQETLPALPLLRRPADRLPGLAGFGQPGEDAPRTVADRAASAFESGAQDESARSVGAISGSRAVGGESRVICRDIPVRVKAVAEQLLGAETNVGVYLGQDSGSR
jgi:hypothetical protein